MSLPNNYKSFPNNVYEPRKVDINNGIFTLYEYHFNGLKDFYDFLKQEPKINTIVFKKDELSSIKGNNNFAGIPYYEALEKLINEYDKDYQEYLKIEKMIKAKSGYSHKYQSVKVIAGGVVNPVAYVTGSPKIYETSRLVKRPKFITINNQVAYYWGTNKKQVFNRALIITNLIKALENKGYSVDVNSFMVAERANEIIEAIFEVKRHGERLNYQALYKTLVDVEFFRRLCFRIIETADVKSDWKDNYGRTSSKNTVQELLHLKKEDIYFDQPSNMNIQGKDIGEDFESAITKLNLDKVIDVEKEKKILRESIKVLKR